MEEIGKNQITVFLAAYKDPKTWESLSVEEKEILALLFVIQGDRQLAVGKRGSGKNFKTALRLTPNRARVFYRKGCAFAKHENDLRLLIQAVSDFEKATVIDPHFYPAWFEWACTLTRIASLNKELSLFQKADQLFARAIEIIQTQERSLRAYCFWKWGLCWFFCGKESGEVIDFQRALEKYHKASRLGFKNYKFWNDYGNALVEHAYLTGLDRVYYDAISLYQKAIVENAGFFDCWYNLACTYHNLFNKNPNDQDFFFAYQCYERAASIESEHGFLWLKWANLLVLQGKFHKNEELLVASLDKFRRADFFKPNYLPILRNYAETLMLLGVYTEKLSYLKEAARKIEKCIEVFPYEVISWYLYGCCLNELGRYFQDERHYLLAIEKFRNGLEINSSEPLLWYGLALSHFSLAEMFADRKMFELADQYCSKVLEFGKNVSQQFWCDWGVISLKLSEMTESLDDLESARHKFEFALKFSEDSDEGFILEPEWLFHYACVLDLLGDYYEEVSYFDKAISLFKKILECDPHNSFVRYHLAIAYSHKGEFESDLFSFEEAIYHFQLIYDEDKEDDICCLDWGITLIHMAQLSYDSIYPNVSQSFYSRAEKKLIDSASLGNIQAFYHLACLYSLCRKNVLAMNYLKRAEKTGSLPPLDDIMQDEWLEGLRQTKSFRNFFNLLLKRK